MPELCRFCLEEYYFLSRTQVLQSPTGITKSRSHYFFLSGSMTSNFPGTCNILPNQNQIQHHSPLIKSSHTTFKMPMKLFLQQLLQERNISASQVSIVEDSARFSSHEGFCTSSSSRYHRGEQSSTVSESFSTETSNEQELIAMRRVSYEANQIWGRLDTLVIAILWIISEHMMRLEMNETCIQEHAHYPKFWQLYRFI